MRGRTNWEKLKAMTEEEIVAAAESDPDAPLITEEELKKFKRVHPLTEIDVKDIRNRLNISQEQFAAYFGVSVRTIQEWEQGRRTPTATARNFLRVIAYNPMLVQKALQATK